MNALDCLSLIQKDETFGRNYRLERTGPWAFDQPDGIVTKVTVGDIHGSLVVNGQSLSYSKNDKGDFVTDGFMIETEDGHIDFLERVVKVGNSYWNRDGRI